MNISCKRIFLIISILAQRLLLAAVDLFQLWYCADTLQRLKLHQCFPVRRLAHSYILWPLPVRPGKKYMHSALSHFTGLFSMHIECVNANGLRADTNFPDVTSPSWWPIPACRSSIQSTCHFCQWQDTEKWIPKRRCILTVAAAIHRNEAAYLQWAASISFT